MWKYSCLLSTERGTTGSGTGLTKRSLVIFLSIFLVLEEYRSVSRAKRTKYFLSI